MSRRLTVFAKGNSDVFESLFACRDASAPWNGLNEALRGRNAEARVRVRHEVMTRSDSLLAAGGDVPAALADLPFEAPYGIASQFSTAIFEEDAGAFVLSIQADVMVRLARHRSSGALFVAHEPAHLPAATRDWLRAECEILPLLPPDRSLENFASIVDRLRRRSAAPILIYNMSAVVPGELVDTYQGLGETLATRIKRFNLALVELSASRDVIVVDVDRIAARYGADRLKLDGARLNCVGCRLIGEDVLRLLEENSCFAA